MCCPLSWCAVCCPLSWSSAPVASPASASWAAHPLRSIVPLVLGRPRAPPLVGAVPSVVQPLARLRSIATILWGTGLNAYIFATEGQQGKKRTTNLIPFSSEKSITMYAPCWVVWPYNIHIRKPPLQKKCSTAIPLCFSSGKTEENITNKHTKMLGLGLCCPYVCI